MTAARSTSRTTARTTSRAAATRPATARRPTRGEPLPPRVGIIMGSKSDWATMKAASDTLTELGIVHECKIVSAHRTPDLLFDYAATAAGRGLQIIIAGAGGAAHLPGMAAAKTHLPVFGVPVQSKTLAGMDSLLSIVQMPKGIPVGTLAIGEAGAVNAALLAGSVLALHDTTVRAALLAYREQQTKRVLGDTL
jgi:5-(carboxyamino)imidazole ribonucleotide mutase